MGDASASATAAVLLEIVQESMGRIATILFAYRVGTALEPECKMYRLLADVYNDAAMILDCLSPMLPRTPRMAVLGFASVLRALCGVAAGSAKASLSAHFAACGNLGELNAKDSSQETLVGLAGMLAGSFVVSRVTSLEATWTLLIMLLAVHLGTNYAAVRAVRMRSLNRQRANLLFSHLWETDHCLTLQQVSDRERIFEQDGVLRWRGDEAVGTAVIGVTLQTLLDMVASTERRPGGKSIQDVDQVLSHLLKIFEDDSYLLWYEAKTRRGVVVLKRGASARDVLQGWVHALHVGKQVTRKTMSTKEVLAAIADSAVQARYTMERRAAEMQTAGFDLDSTSIETRSSFRVAFSKHVPGRKKT